MRNRTGMTLIELLAALAIASMLAIAALAVATNLSRAEAIGRRQEQAGSIRDQLRHLLAADVAHARRARAAEGGFELQTRCRLAPETLELGHAACVVRYQVASVGGSSWLLRRQRDPDGASLTELVCGDANSIRLVVDGKPAARQWKALPFDVPVSVIVQQAQGSLEFTWRVR
ncbi:MAG: prepilin-type N-terminal cleavage/methylation domain-containing protein [Phycisphaerae bacterium]|nr:prepilin-type N-terminal cleavage/methylation domain-containing protein [Phycisphaerae bacterium]